MHFSTGDTWQLGIGWLNKADYGEGGFFIMLGKLYIQFWRRPDWVKEIEEGRRLAKEQNK